MTGSERLRIAFLTGTYPVRSQTFIQRKMDYLLDEGHDVHVFCVRSEKELPAFRRWKKRIHHLPSSLAQLEVLPTAARLCRAMATGTIPSGKIWGLQREIRSQGGARAISLAALAALSGGRWDIVHAHFLTSLDLILGVRNLIDCPVVASGYGHEATVSRYNPGVEARMRKNLRQIDGIIYLSRFLQDALYDLTPASLETTILPPEVERDIFRARIRTNVNEPIRLLSVGRLHWTKGFVYALSAIRILLDRGINCTYRILGEGPARTEIEYAIRQLRLQKIVQLEGAASPEDVAQAMDWADVLLVPSVKEEFGVVILEAQSAGVPVVASKVGGISEACRDGVTSLLVQPRESEELASAIRQLVLNPELYRSFSQEGPKFAEAFAAPKIGARLVEIYRNTIRNWQCVVEGESRAKETLLSRREKEEAALATNGEAPAMLARKGHSS